MGVARQPEVPGASDLDDKFGTLSPTGLVRLDLGFRRTVINVVRPHADRVYAAGSVVASRDGSGTVGFVVGLDAASGDRAQGFADGGVFTTSFGIDIDDPDLSGKDSSQILDVLPADSSVWALHHSATSIDTIYLHDIRATSLPNPARRVPTPLQVNRGRSRVLLLGDGLIACTSWENSGIWVSMYNDVGTLNVAFGQDGTCTVPGLTLIDASVDSSDRIVLLASKPTPGGGSQVLVRRMEPATYFGGAPTPVDGHADPNFVLVVTNAATVPSRGTLLTDGDHYTILVDSTIARFTTSGNPVATTRHQTGSMFGEHRRIGGLLGYGKDPQTGRSNLSAYTDSGTLQGPVPAGRTLAAFNDVTAMASGRGRIFVALHEELPTGALVHPPDQDGWVASIVDQHRRLGSFIPTPLRTVVDRIERTARSIFRRFGGEN